MGFHPAIKLVDIDKLILQWAIELSEPAGLNKITPVCADAYDFLQADKETYALLVVDIFEGRVVPSFVTSIEFLKQCRNHVMPGGYLVLNYIVNENSAWDKVKTRVDEIFPGNRIIQFDINRIFIAEIR
jgi:spermidine synthase